MMSLLLPPSLTPLLPTGYSVDVLGSADTAIGSYYVVSLIADESGGQALLCDPKVGPAKMLKIGTTIFPLPKELSTADATAIAGIVARRTLLDSPSMAPGYTGLWSHLHPALQEAIASHIQLTNTQYSDSLDQKIYSTALSCDGTLITSNVPGTEQGNLACAWAVNEVIRRATGQTISQELLSTDSIYDALVDQGRGLPFAGGSPPPGSIIIAPSSGDVHGHVGIVGENDVVYSNSSSLGKWWHSYTLASWHQRYDVTLRLQTRFFQLNPAIFAAAVAPMAAAPAAMVSVAHEEQVVARSNLLAAHPGGENVIVDLWGGDSPHADFVKTFASGIKAVIHKATDPLHGPDRLYATHRAAARKAGLLWGSYHFGRLGDGASQADSYLEFAQPQADEFICLDFERDDKHPDTVMTVAQAEAFVTRIREKLGRLPKLYGGAYLREQHVPNTSVLCQCALWIADYRTNPVPEIPTSWHSWGLWQWVGDVADVSGLLNCDRSIFNGDMAGLQRFWA